VLVRSFLAHFRGKLGKTVHEVSQESMRPLEAHSWTGEHPGSYSTWARVACVLARGRVSDIGASLSATAWPAIPEAPDGGRAASDPRRARARVPPAGARGDGGAASRGVAPRGGGDPRVHRARCGSRLQSMGCEARSGEDFARARAVSRELKPTTTVEYYEMSRRARVNEATWRSFLVDPDGPE